MLAFGTNTRNKKFKEAAVCIAHFKNYRLMLLEGVARHHCEAESRCAGISNKQGPLSEDVNSGSNRNSHSQSHSHCGSSSDDSSSSNSFSKNNNHQPPDYEAHVIFVNSSFHVFIFFEFRVEFWLNVRHEVRTSKCDKVCRKELHSLLDCYQILGYNLAMQFKFFNSAPVYYSRD